jgi:hypothetical protein
MAWVASITAVARMSPYTPCLALPLVRMASGRQSESDLVEGSRTTGILPVS